MRKTCKRTVRDPMAWLAKRTPLAVDQVRDISIAYHASLQALLRGNGTEQAWSTLACSFNVALILAEDGVSANAIETIKLGQDALLRARDRAKRVGKWAFDGDGIRLVMATANIHDEQIERASRAQVVAALQEVYRRIEIGETA